MPLMKLGKLRSLTGSGVPWVALTATASSPVVEDIHKQGSNLIDIWNLRLELGHKLRQGLRMRLETHFLAVGLGEG